ncbi:MAG: HAMP domain-containing sensor histidine kinase [Candidatus Nitrosocosmicus sp.]
MNFNDNLKDINGNQGNIEGIDKNTCNNFNLNKNNSNDFSSNLINNNINWYEKTIVVYGEKETTKLIIKVLYNSKNRWDNYASSEGPTIAMGVTPLKNGMKNAYERGVKIRYISEITKHNIHHCKELMKISKLRHLDEAKGGMAVNETEYIATAYLQEAKPVAHLIYSNVKEIVAQQQQIFESFWNQAIPAEQKIKEIEEGMEPVKTKVLENEDDIYNHFNSSIKKSKERYACSSIGGMQMVYNNFFNLYKDIIEKQKKGESSGIKWLTYIDDTKNTIELVKTFLNAGIQVRHIKNLPSMNFSFDSNSIQATIDRMHDGKIMNSLLVSNELAYVRHFTSYFHDLWNNNGIDALERIKDIEEGMEYDIEVIRHSDRALDVYLNIVKSAQSEIFFIFPTPRSFVRQLKAIDSANQASKERKVKVRILTPSNEIVDKSIKHLLKEEKQEHPKNSKDSFSSNDIDVRCIENMSYTKSSILVVDKKESLVMELKDDTKDTFIEAIGLCIHSTSKASVLSYISIFENLWKQSELYQEIKESNEKLEVKDKILNEFIHIAAHELRNPIQPILGLSQTIKSLLAQKEKLEINKDKLSSLFDIIIQNSRKLQKLSEDLLDIAKIEKNLLYLNKEIFNLMELLQVLIDDCKSQQINNLCDIKFHSIIKERYQNEDFFLITADKARISQVVSNLLLNALKFTNDNDCLIDVFIDKKDTNGRRDFIVSIKDSGPGIDPEVYPRLFTKFASKSDKGIGLGLFICKSIIETHGGTIWAKNNSDGKGATFAFSLPSVIKQDNH